MDDFATTTEDNHQLDVFNLQLGSAIPSIPVCVLTDWQVVLLRRDGRFGWRGDTLPFQFNH